MAKTKVIAVANQKGDLTKMLGLRKPNDLPLTLGNVMNNIVAGVSGVRARRKQPIWAQLKSPI